MTNVYSIGYQRRSPDELCEALRAAGVEVLLDVRARAWSQRPEFRKTAFASALKKVGIKYVHFKQGGNPYRPKKGELASIVECEKRFRGHIVGHPEVVGELAEIIATRKVALFCYEGSHRECHRGVLLQEVGRRIGDLEITEV